MRPKGTRREVIAAGVLFTISGCAGDPDADDAESDETDPTSNDEVNETEEPPPEGPAFEIVSLESSDSTLTGEELTVEYAVRNVGDVAGTATIVVQLIEAESAEELSSDGSVELGVLLEQRDEEGISTVTEQALLDAGSTHRGRTPFDTSGFDPGRRIVAIATGDDYELAQFEVTQPVVHVRNPYEGIDWDAVEHHKCEFHNHPQKWEEPHRVIDLYHGSGRDAAGRRLSDGDGYTVFSVADMGIYSPTRWPWTELSEIEGDDRDPAELGVVSFPGSELRHGIEHVSVIFSTATDHHHDAENRLDAIIDVLQSETDEPRTLAVIAHPERYYWDPDDAWERYIEDFRSLSLEDGLVGFEILNKDSTHRGFGPGDDAMPDLDLWDNLLTEFMPERPIWGYSVDDASEFVVGQDVDVRWTELLLHHDEFDPSDQPSSRRAAKDAMLYGRFFGVERAPWDHATTSPPEPATIEQISVDGDRITLDASAYETIRWVSCGETVDTGSELSLTREMMPYVRAEVWTEDAATVTITQPFGLADPADG